MIASRRYLAFAGIAGLALMGLHTGTATSEDRGGPPPPSAKPASPRLDRGKTIRIEPSIANIVRNASNPAAGQPFGGFPMPPNGQPFRQARPRIDVGKSGVIEPQFQQFVQAATAFNSPPGFGPPPQAKDEFVNPKVEPGKVRWHKSFEEARAAALKSKIPIMIFQMMGKLDDQFC
jgi:hypothetical protein